MTAKSLLPDLWKSGRSWRPTREMNRLQNRIDRMFDEFFPEPFSGFYSPAQNYIEPTMTGLLGSGYVPACDVEETKSHYELIFDLPGITKDEVKIDLQDNYLTISGERKQEHAEDTKGRTSRERYYGTFTRSFMLPSNVNIDKIEAFYESGVLHITIPKASVSSGKQIPINETKRVESKSERAA